MTITAPHTPQTALAVAIRRAGNPSRLARMIGVRPHSIYKWEAEGRVPLRRVPAVSQHVRLPPWFLRPDLPHFFPPPPPREADKESRKFIMDLEAAL